MSGSAGARFRAFPGMDSVIAVLNPFIALIVNSMQSMQAETKESVRAGALAAHDEREVLSRQIEALSAEVRQMREALRKD